MPAWLAWGLNLPLLVLAVIGLRRAAPPGALGRGWFGWGLALRLGGGAALGGVYGALNVNRGGDTLTLHRQALALARWGAAHPAAYLKYLLTGAPAPGAPEQVYAAYSNAHFFVRLLSALHCLTGGSYWLSGLWLSVAAFAGTWLLARELARVAPGARRGAALGALAWPANLLWMSGLSKDALLLLGLGSFTAAALRLLYPPATSATYDGPRAAWWAGLAGGGWLLWKLKFFLAATVFVAFGALAVAEWVVPRLQARWPRLRTWHLLVVSALILVPLTQRYEGFGAEFIRFQVLRNQRILSIRTILLHGPEEPIMQFPLTSSLGSLARWAPAAAVGTFGRPLPWEGVGWGWRALGLDTLALWLLTASAAAGWWRRGRPLGLPPLALALLAVIVLMAALFGLTTPNLGTLVRYRAALVPYAFFLLDWWRAGSKPAYRGALARDERSE